MAYVDIFEAWTWLGIALMIIAVSAALFLIEGARVPIPDMLSSTTFNIVQWNVVDFQKQRHSTVVVLVTFLSC